VLFAGRLVEKKGVVLVLETAALAAEFDLLVAGDGPLRDLLGNAGSNVRWLGAVDARAMHQLYAAADLVLLPSRGEGLPLVVQEALSCGLPVVISNDEVYAGALERAGACITAARTPPALHSALLNGLEHRPVLSAAARAYAEANWTRDGMIARYETVFESLL
jgi:glycosyltransferase involved in cell wall biosynthesis